eukprot:TRINITY_DN74237_c0_g1_i1.p1 TRINITY_DN74237_c0_g1~~TRINITY_DN74237_c0_g1_i1.p1  ORF type:complete len:666 (+),score=146.34 TRINITY_DN74237_c0_g1_i1:99-2096(+)
MQDEQRYTASSWREGARQQPGGFLDAVVAWATAAALLPALGLLLQGCEGEPAAKPEEQASDSPTADDCDCVSPAGWSATSGRCEAGAETSLEEAMRCRGSCLVERWPDRGSLCGDCQAVVHMALRAETSCEGYCAALGLSCAGGWPTRDGACDAEALQERSAASCQATWTASEVACECSPPEITSNSAAPSSATTTTQPREEETDPCGTASWPNRMKGGLECGECRVHVERFGTLYGTCEKYCKAAGRICEGAWDVLGSTSCWSARRVNCDTPIDDIDGMCECHVDPSSTSTAGPAAGANDTRSGSSETAGGPAVSAAASDSVKVMSYNLFGWNAFGTNRWKGDNIVDKIREYSPDVIGCQEVETGGGNGYDSVAEKIKDRGTYTDAAGSLIFYRAATVKHEATGWLDLGKGRGLGWAVLDKQGMRFLFFNTHWCHDCGTEYLFRDSAVKVAEEIRRARAKHSTLPAIFVGDLNVLNDCENAKAIRYLKGESVDGKYPPVHLVDAHEGQGGTLGKCKIDYVFSSLNEWQVKSAIIDRDHREGGIGSDHDALYAELSPAASERTSSLAAVCQPSDAAWEAMAEGHTCGQRIRWLQDNSEKSALVEAQQQVASEFPTTCGACGSSAPRLLEQDLLVSTAARSLQLPTTLGSLLFLISLLGRRRLLAW